MSLCRVDMDDPPSTDPVSLFHHMQGCLVDDFSLSLRFCGIILLIDCCQVHKMNLLEFEEGRFDYMKGHKW